MAWAVRSARHRSMPLSHCARLRSWYDTSASICLLWSSANARWLCNISLFSAMASSSTIRCTHGLGSAQLGSDGPTNPADLALLHPNTCSTPPLNG